MGPVNPMGNEGSMFYSAPSKVASHLGPVQGGLPSWPSSSTASHLGPVQVSLSSSTAPSSFLAFSAPLQEITAPDSSRPPDVRLLPKLLLLGSASPATGVPTSSFVPARPRAPAWPRVPRPGLLAFSQPHAFPSLEWASQHYPPLAPRPSTKPPPFLSPFPSLFLSAANLGRAPSHHLSSLPFPLSLSAGPSKLLNLLAQSRCRLGPVLGSPRLAPDRLPSASGGQRPLGSDPVSTPAQAGPAMKLRMPATAPFLVGPGFFRRGP